MKCELLGLDNVWHDITPFIAYNGWKVSRNDVDGPNAGRNITGTMIRDRVATKIRIDVTCVPMDKRDLDMINTLLQPDMFYMRYKDDGGEWTTLLVYSNNYAWTYFQKMQTGEEFYFDFGFPLIEI